MLKVNRWIVCVALVFAGAMSGTAVAEEFSLDLVYLGGHTVVPGEIETFNGPAISWSSTNSWGQVSSLGGWTKPGEVFGELGIFKWESGVLTDLMKNTDVTDAPGFNQPVGSVQRGIISDSGRVLFDYQVDGVDALALGSTRANLIKLADSDEIAPGNASSFVFMGDPQHNGTRFAVYGQSEGDIGIWTGSEQAGIQYQFVQEDKTAVPGTTSFVDDLAFHEPAINTTGYAAVEAGWDNGKSAIIFGNPASTLSTVMKTGDAVPGLSGRTFTEASRPRLNNSNTVAFRSSFIDAVGASSSGLFRWSEGDVDVVAIRDVTQVPGEAGGTLLESISSPTLSGDDKVYFTGAWEGFDRHGIFVDVEGSGLGSLVKDGDAAPGTGLTFTGFSAVHANAVGDFIFLAGLSDGRRGLFGTKNGGTELVKLLLTGQVVDATGDGVMAPIADIMMSLGSGGEDGAGVWFNDAGQVLVELGFDPSRALPRVNSGLYLVTIPEPGGLVVLGIAGCVLLRRR